MTSLTTAPAVPLHERAVLTVSDRVAELRLTRPAAGNAIDPSMVEAIDQAVRSVEEGAASGEVRSLLLLADGRSFCVGGDLRHFDATMDDLHGQFSDMIGTWHDSTLPRLAALPVPVVAAVQGGVAGGGLGLVWCADVVVAADDLKLVNGFLKLGLSGDGGSTWHLPRLVGLRRAMELVLRTEPLTAAEALDWHLVTRVVPREQLEADARAEARRLAALPPFAFGALKRLLLQSASSTYGTQLAGELEAMLAESTRPDVRSGMRAFLSGVQPVFDAP